MITKSNIQDVIKVLIKATNKGRLYWNTPKAVFQPMGPNYRYEYSYFAKYRNGEFIIALRTTISGPKYTMLTKADDESQYTAHNSEDELQKDLSKLYELIREKSTGSYALINALLHDESLL